MIFITRDETIKSRAIAYIQGLTKPMQIKISEPRRSVAQSNYFHMLIDIIAEHTGESKHVEKMRIKFECLPLEKINIANGSFLFPISEADTTKEQERAMIDAALVRGMSLGLIMPSAALHGIEL